METNYRIKHAWLLLLLLVTVLACKKNNNSSATGIDSVRTGNNNQPLITRYEYAPNLYTLFTYNNAGQLTTITDVNDIARTDYTVTYKSDGKIDQVNYTNGYWKFTYINNLLDRADAYTNGNPLQAYYQFVYSGQNVVQELFYSNYGTNTIQPRSRINFHYDTNGDIIRADTYLWDTTAAAYYPAGYQLYQSDTHPNPVYGLRDVFMVLYRVVGPHNFTRAEFLQANGSIDQNNTYDFTYNSLGYPVSAVRRNLAAGTNDFVTLRFDYQ